MRLKLKPLTLFAATGLLLAGYPAMASAAGIETIGNKSLPEANYQKWPNLAQFVNDTNRVYERIANGDDDLFFAGNTAALNGALQRFAAIHADAHEVVLLPGPAFVSSTKGDKTFDYDWSFKISAGISSSAKSGPAWVKNPQLTVYIDGEDIDLSQLQMPKSVTVLALADLRKRYIDAIQTSEVGAIRGWSAGQLAHLDPYSSDSVRVVTRMLGDTNEWVRLNAASALAAFGKTAVSALPQLRQTAVSSDDELKDRLEIAIAAIEAASDVPSSKSRGKRSAILENISDFCKSLPQKNEK